MTTTSSSAAADAIISLSDQKQTVALWTYVHLRVPRFTSEAALEVVKRVASQIDEEPKTLAKRLRKELALKGVAVKHAAALEAAARMLGHSSWHAANREGPKPKLKVTTTSSIGEEKVFANWRELASALCASCEEWLQEKPSRVFQVRFGLAHMMISVPMPKEDGSAEKVETWPLLVVNPVGTDAGWLDGAPAALETLRRHLEERGKAIVDGIAVLQLCGTATDLLGDTLPQPVRAEDVCNSELILMRADHELDPGYEIARGDEMTCWSQFELAIDDHKSHEVVLDGGAWRVGNGRYVWQWSTLHPKDIVPGLVIRELGEDDSTKLYRRFKLARCLFKNHVTHHEQTKRLEYLGTLAESYRVDLHRLLLAMKKAGLTWEGFCAEVGESRPMVPNLPVGFVFSLLERLKLEDPNAVFARPARSDLSRVDDDKLLRGLAPRVDHVRYRLPAGVPADIKNVISEAIEDFSTSMRLQKLQAAGNFIDPKNPLPHLVYASDANELRETLAGHGLVMYAGVMPHLLSTKDLIEQVPNAWPFAIGNSLFLDIDFDIRGSEREAKAAA